MTHRITNPDFVTLIVTVGVRTTVSVKVEVQVPRADADNFDLDPDNAVNSLDPKIVETSAADSDTFSDLENIETLNQAAAEALSEYRATLETP